jgi:uncharacterized protein YmfQ (DUF2313 family)
MTCHTRGEHANNCTTDAVKTAKIKFNMSINIENEVIIVWQVVQDISIHQYVMSSTAFIVGKTILFLIYLDKW